MSEKYAKINDNIVTDIILSSLPELHAQNSGDMWVDVTNMPFARIGDIYEYDEIKASCKIYPEKPFASWTQNEETYQWESPVAYPSDDKKYIWDEDNGTWENA